MAYVVCRIAKLKTLGNIAGAAAHNARIRPTPNADPEREHLNRTLLGSGDGLADVRDKLDQVTGKIRSNAVLAVEMVLTASPEWFTAGGSVLGRVDSYCEAALAALLDRYGNRLAAVELHMDEDTPHLHAILVPLEDKPDGTVNLNCRGLFGGAAKLRALQTWAGVWGQAIGLERGKTRVEEAEAHEDAAAQPLPSRRRHIGPAEYRARVQEDARQAVELRQAAETDRLCAGQEMMAARQAKEAVEVERRALAQEREMLELERSRLRTMAESLSTAFRRVAQLKRFIPPALFEAVKPTIQAAVREARLEPPSDERKRHAPLATPPHPLPPLSGQ